MMADCFLRLSLDMTPTEQSKEEAEMMMQLLIYLAQSTSVSTS